MPQYDTLPDTSSINTAVKALEANGFSVRVVADEAAAKQAVLQALPKGAEVLTVSSQTLEVLGLNEAINESGGYDAIRPKLLAMMGDETKKREARKIGTAPDFVVGSVQALTQDGHALIASASGSQLPSYTFGAGHVIWVVGAQKIVKDVEQAHDRLLTHTFPLEDARAQVAYGANSSINFSLLFNKDYGNRVEIIIVKKVLGY
jgi:L-lactate utilization protein LutC